jgi:alanyl-tRNA synthetase
VLTSNQIRSDFIKFFEQRGHKFVPSAPVVPIGDATLLFTNAGMNQFKDIFLGLSSPGYTRAANSQKCIRAGGKHNDLEEVGVDTYHHTFFEMLGNWSFGDYFKAEAIGWAWQLLTDVWKMEPTRLHATYFEGDEAHRIGPDEESRQLWGRFLPEERIHPGNLKDNFWEMGETGPCGPCSEIHYDDTLDKSGGSLVNKDEPSVIEIWNLVFIQFNRNSDGKLSPLPARHVDTGMGLERVARFMQGKKSNYDTDLFTTLMNAISGLTGKKYDRSETDEKDIAFRVIADHLRTLTFAITDGCVPSNEGRGYVLRRILRRASRFGRVLGMHEPFIYKLIPTLTGLMGEAFGEIRERQEFVAGVIESEEASFGRTLDRGIEIFSSAAQRAEKSKDKTISGDDAFALYDTYGFPLDLTQLMARERGLKVDTEKFDELMEEQRQRARAAQKVDSISNLLGSVYLASTDDSLKYKTNACESIVTNIIDLEDKSNIIVGSISAHPAKEYGLVLEETCFYAKMGGQVGDCGIIRSKSNSGEFVVETTEKLGETVIHWGKVATGSFVTGNKVSAFVDKNRENTKKNHTATHLLQWALRKVLGDTVTQQGSLVCADYLRFDFIHSKSLTDEEKKKVEYLVREKIAEDLPVSSTELPVERARKLGAMALFGEKYGDVVRVVAVGAEDGQHLDEAFSREFCGGTHVERLGTIGGFKITKEESIASGVRRITALTGGGLTEYLSARSDAVDELSRTLKVPAEQIIERVSALIEENKRLGKELKATSKRSGIDVVAEAKQLLEKCEKIGETSVVIGKLSPTTAEQARSAVDMVKKKAKSVATVFGYVEGDRANLIAGVTDDLIKKGIKAGDIVKEIAPIIDGGGGGRPQMAQAGGKNAEKIDEALARATEIIKKLIG